MKIFICGLGAIGSNLLDQLCTMHPEIEYHAVDFDLVEERNIKTQFYFEQHVGIKKAMAIRSSIHTKHSTNQISIQAYPQKIMSHIDLAQILFSRDFDPNKDLIVDCFDNIEARTYTTEIEYKNILHAAFNPNLHGEITWQEQYKVPKVHKDDVDICTNPLARPFISFFVSLLAMTIEEFIGNNEKNNYIVFNKNNIRKVS